MSCPVCDSSSGTDEKHIVSPFIHKITCPRCGGFSLVEPLNTHVFKIAPYKETAFLLSVVLREATEAGIEISVTDKNINDLLGQISPPRNPLEAIDRLLLFLANRKRKGFFDSYRINFSDDRSILALNEIQDCQYCVKLANRMGFIEKTDSSIRLDIKGWERVDELRRSSRLRDQVFVAMWFDEQMDLCWKNAIEPAIKELGLGPLRIDFIEHSDRTDERIMIEIRRSRIVVADFTGNRGGVYFEAGYALGLRIPVVWTCRKDYFEGNPPHFDTRQYNHILWINEDDLRKRLKDRVEAILALPAR